MSRDQKLNQGERIGLIRFGSRVDLFFNNKKTLAKVGQNVTAGESLLARNWCKKKNLKSYKQKKLDTFSVSFKNSEYDESKYQKLMSNFLGSNSFVLFSLYYKLPNNDILTNKND